MGGFELNVLHNKYILLNYTYVAVFICNILNKYL